MDIEIKVAYLLYKQGPLLLTRLNKVEHSRISKYINYNMLYKIIYPFPNFNGKTVEDWEWTFYWVLDYLSILGLKLNHVSKRGPSL